MKLIVTRPTEIDVTAIRCKLPVRYGTEDISDDFPLLCGDFWDLTIDVETGAIAQWPADYPTVEVSMKVVDEGFYYLLNGEEVVASIEEDYVPSCVPGHYGDYIDFRIEAGIITNWKPTPAEIVRAFFRDRDE